MSHALRIYGLGLGASENEGKIQYRQMAREYHPEKNNPEVTGLTVSEALDFIELLNNANMFL
jgi:DnaJ-class molecular chaperone